MDSQKISADTTVAETLRRARSATKVFVAYRTACVGCSLARFCTLGDVTRTYEIELRDFLTELQLVVQAESLQATGAHYEESD